MWMGILYCVSYSSVFTPLSVDWQEMCAKRLKFALVLTGPFTTKRLMKLSLLIYSSFNSVQV